MKELTKDEAVALFNSNWWRDASDDTIVRFQLFQTRLCLPFDRFHAAVEKVLKRPVWTHEFAGDAGQARLQREYLGAQPAPTLSEIMEQIPAAKRVVIVV